MTPHFSRAFPFDLPWKATWFAAFALPLQAARHLDADTMRPTPPSSMPTAESGMRKRSVILVFVLSTFLALASSAVHRHTTVNYPDIEGCSAGCTVAAAGWPFPYLADYPGLSPAGRTSLVEAITGSDHVLWTSFVLTWLAWTVAIGALAYLLRRRSGPQKRRRH
jgi:hypothetical protein